MLAAKQGQRGDRGERGAKGDPGPHIEAIHIHDCSLILVRSDGVALECNLEPMLARLLERVPA